MSSPLFLGNDPRNMSPEEKEIITNELAISVNQDPTGQGCRIKKEGNTEVWMKKLNDGKRAVLLLNRDSEKTRNIEITLNGLGLTGKAKILDIYKRKNRGKTSGSISEEVQPRSGLFLIVG
jgi:alpha-galactosidase